MNTKPVKFKLAALPVLALASGVTPGCLPAVRDGHPALADRLSRPVIDRGT